MDPQQNQYAKLLMGQSKYTEEEGNTYQNRSISYFFIQIHQSSTCTIEIPKGSENNLILAFEESDDCNMFAQMLKEMEFVEPSASFFSFDFLK